MCCWCLIRVQGTKWLHINFEPYSCLYYTFKQEFCEKDKLATTRAGKATEQGDTTEKLMVNDQRVIMKEESPAAFGQLKPMKDSFVLINATICMLHTHLPVVNFRCCPCMTFSFCVYRCACVREKYACLREVNYGMQNKTKIFYEYN